MGRLTRGLKSGSFDWYMPGWAGPPPVDSYVGGAGDPSVSGSTAAMRISAVWACTKLISDTFATLPLVLYKRGDDADRARATGHPLYRILHDAPNPHMTSFTWRQVAMYHLLHWGNTYAEKVRENGGRGAIVSLEPLMPDRMQVRWSGGQRLYDYSTGGRVVTMDESKVFHVPGLGYNGLVGFPVLTLMRRTLDSYGAARDFGASFFRHGARPAVVIKHPEKMSKPAIARLRAQMDELRGAGNAGKTVLMEEGSDIKELGHPAGECAVHPDQDLRDRRDRPLVRRPAAHDRRGQQREHELGHRHRAAEAGLPRLHDVALAGRVHGRHHPAAPGRQPAELLRRVRDRRVPAGRPPEALSGLHLRAQRRLAVGQRIRARENMNAREDPGGDEYLLPMNMESVGEDDGSLTMRVTSGVDPRTTPPGPPALEPSSTPAPLIAAGATAASR